MPAKAPQAAAVSHLTHTSADQPAGRAGSRGRATAGKVQERGENNRAEAGIYPGRCFFARSAESLRVMHDAVRSTASFSLPTLILRRTGALALVALSATLAGCGKDGGDAPASEQGGESSSASGSGGKSTTSSGGKGATGGETTTSSGAPATGGTEAGAGAPTGDAGAAGAGTDEPAPSGEGLGAADGITGTFAGMAHTATFGVVHVPQQTSTSVVGATTAMYPPYESWRIRFTAKLGTQSCTGATGPDDSAIDFGSLTDFDAAGTTANKTCSITLTSLAPKYEGTFTATLGTAGGDVVVTEGAFRVPN
jgi:hypothetical protein